MVKKLSILFLLIIIAICLFYWEILAYGFFQARGQLKVIMGAQPIEYFLENPDFPDSLKQKLRLTQEVRRFAIDVLGMKSSDNYTKMYDQQGKVLLWNVSASEPFQLKAYTWRYPFLGKMPYRGFFELKRAKKEAEKLKEQGYDVRIRPVGGWSTLGILEDPLLSNMLDRTDGALAELIIHELTHATIFIREEVEFNENLASFIGEYGAQLFLTSHYGDSSQQHLEYNRSEADARGLTQLILRGAKSLDSLYSTMSDDMQVEMKDSLKQQAILSIKSSLKNTSFYDSAYQRIFDETLPNNAYFMAFRRYHDQEDSIRSIFESYDRDFHLMIKELKKTYGK